MALAYEKHKKKTKKQQSQLMVSYSNAAGQPRRRPLTFTSRPIMSIRLHFLTPSPSGNKLLSDIQISDLPAPQRLHTKKVHH